MGSAAYRVLITASMQLIERSVVPDFVIRFVMRLIVARRAAALGKRSQAEADKHNLGQEADLIMLNQQRRPSHISQCESHEVWCRPLLFPASWPASQGEDNGFYT